MTSIRLASVHKTYPDGTSALRGVDLHVPEGSAFGLIGPSGAGKSTVARLVEGLERPTSGEVRVGDVDLAKLDEASLVAQRRRIGVVFQHFNLLAQRDVARNVALPLELAGVPRADRDARVAELLALVGLDGLAHRFPAQLSGGQKQRVGIARALAAKPSLLVLDEATSALDPTTAANIVELLAELRKKSPITMLVITHQLEVVRALCTHVAVLEHGLVRESGLVSELRAELLPGGGAHGRGRNELLFSEAS
ncbi:Methionine ABC transporter ATP-binding protein [Labilithrix luteola]|uniref:Methionine ABC transporter ATP-binding protein n=1 Tax=Labilithrix luteola TaxID=1391654 RepID=A0A0K1Q4D5_9BACT|nr:ATP-binding cassette domain-containing protein [Labilithrix luteola]AKV00517.1 Methionine ABC transporter ATP-binding protein [Labilithrix luteola]